MGVEGTLDFRGPENLLHLIVTAKGLEVRAVPEAWGLDERLRKLGGRAERQGRRDREV